ncbi:PREDICTED: NADH-cytochrome b5 reductase-like [Dinoponera quadriceps]|uniref:NADH-cytochrome b5 reductase-like n=1 Tax=Dinoponera quadriceps TaxID=609295 RepID=A0A6P3Y0K6_DINQU|nr:PREDICTED: NADH-cytochrome b5 reductase-like [Dinoponera quadriceps]
MDLDDHNDDNDRPKTPLEEDCCGNGCIPCVFDVHKRLLNEWENRKAQDVKIKISSNLLSLLSYKAFVIADISETSKDYILVHLEYQEYKMQNSLNLYLIPGQYIMLHSWCMSRPYTPITWTKRGLVLLVKVYKQGKFSIHLKNAPLGSSIDVRGPYGDFKYESNSFRQIIMFGIGSGIAALYPIARTIVDDETELTKVHLIVGFQSVEHVPLKKELRCLTDYWNFKCTLQLSQLNNKTIGPHGLNIKIGRLNKLLVADYLQCNDTETTLILICGTSEFNRSMKEWIQEMNYTHLHIFE